jgi:hypothetical protein
MSQSFICIHNGVYRGKQISNTIFPLVKQYQSGAKGGFVTVVNNGFFSGFPDEIRVKVNSLTDYSFSTAEDYATQSGKIVESYDVAVPQQSTETDEEIMSRISERFDILHNMTRAACEGNIRAMIVVGPPGVGKSFGVEAELEKASFLDTIAGRRIKSEVVKGAATPIGLYQMLYKYSDKDNVLVFDDCDMLFYDDLSLNLLKAALDTSKRRKICWNSESRVLRQEGIPEQFDFKGSIIFITNLSFDHIRSKKLQDHLVALESRCHYLDLTLNTVRDKLLRVKQIANTGELFDDYDFTAGQQAEIIDFLFEHHTKLREISLRTALKIADLYKSFPGNWQQMAKTTVLKNAV